MKKYFFLFVLQGIFLLNSCNNTKSNSDEGGKGTDSARKGPGVITTHSDTVSLTQKTDTVSNNKTATCADVVEEILTTSPTFVQKTRGLEAKIIKNGGTSYGTMLEGSPAPKRDNAQQYSKTYDFNLHESYPDRMTVIARYVFDPVKRQLYKYDDSQTELILISFDKNLLPKFDKACK